MATSSRPKRQTTQRCLEYNGGLLHEEELAIRRALQASLNSSRHKSETPTTTSKHDKNSSDSPDSTTSTIEDQLQNNNNNLANSKATNTKRKKTRQNSISEDETPESSTTPTKSTKKQKLLKDGKRTRSRSSSLNSSMTTDSSQSSTVKNPTTKHSTKNSSSVSRTNVSSQKMKEVSQKKLHKKDKIAIRVRKKLLKEKILRAGKVASNVSDCESTKSSSTVSEIVTSRKAKRGRKRKCPTPLVQKKFASITPSSSSIHSSSSFEVTTSGSLEKAEDFIDFLCLRGHPFMPKELEVFNNNNTLEPSDVTPSDDESPSSPPSSLLSELPSSPASSNPLQNSVDSSCETPVCETPLNSEDDVAIGGIHALRMYAGIENRPKTNNSSEEKRELTIAEVDSEEEANKIPKSVTPPLSFRVSPRSAPPVSDKASPNLTPSPGPLMATSQHLNLPSTSGMNLYPTPDGSAFGSPHPPPLLLSPSKSSLSSNNCCSPPPLLYIPAAAQRVTHLHGPPKLERIEASRMEKVHRENREANTRDSPPVLVKQKPSDFTIESRFVRKETSKNTVPSNRDANPTEISHLPGDQELSPVEPPCSDNILPRPSSTGGIRINKNRPNALNSPPGDDNTSLEKNLRTFQPYTRDSRSCPLHSSANERGEAKSTNDFSRRKSQDLSPNTSGYMNQEFCPLHSSKESKNENSPVKKISVIDLSNVDSPVSSVSLGGTSLLENLQKVHDGNTSTSPARDGTSGSDQNESESVLDKRDSRVQDTSSIGSVSPSPNIQVYKTPLNSNLVAKSASSGIEQDELSPCLHRPLTSSATNTLYCSVDKTRTSPFAPVPVRDMITPTRTPPASGHFVRQFGVPLTPLTQTTPPYECAMQDPLSPPWSHLQPSYSINNTPPRPYTLPINNPSASSVNTNHCCSSHRQYAPRAIPVLPPTQLPAFQQGTLVHFNGEYRSSHELGCVNFGHNLMVNQNYNLPRAFESTSPRKAQPCSESGKYDFLNNRKSGDGLPDKNNADNLSKKTSSHMSNPSSHGVSVDLTTDNTNLISSQPPEIEVTSTPRDPHTGTEASRDPHTGTEDSQTSHGRKSGDVTNPSAESNVKKSVDTEIKKRRGRPPGSKNKKTMAKNTEGEAHSKKESPSKGETPKNEEETEPVNPKVVKTKKVESPILRPTDEEFKDPIKYLKSVQATLKKFGICIIDPPESWKLESHLPGNPRFTTKRQLIHRLQKRWGPTEIKLACIEKHIQQQQSSFHFTQMPVVGGCDLDLPEVSRVVNDFGGMQKVIDTKKWNKVADLLRIPKSTQDRVGKLQDAYCKYLLSFDLLPESEKEALEKQVKQEIQETESKQDADQEKCYLKGRSFSMGCFQRTARSFQDHFFKSEPSVNEVEREYWKIVQSRERYVAAHHIKLDTQQHGSCFPTSKTDPYTKSGWNLNVLPVLKGSSLRHAGQVEDLTIPWLNIDMLFSTKRWTTTPLQTYLIDYLHSSTDKVWYGVPESDIEKFPYTKKDRTNDFEDGEAMVSPSHMTRESDINITRLVQKQGQFVVIAPEVFHCNISCGYSVSETVAFAFSDWILKTPSLNTELFTEWPGFSYEKVLLKLADEITDSETEILESLHRDLERVREREISSRKELKGLGVLEGSCTNTTSKGVQTIKTKSGCIQVHSTTMYCGQCNQLCHLSAVLGEDSELLCLSDAVDYIREENTSDSLSIVTNCSVTQLDEVIESVRNKLNQEQDKKPQQ